MSTSVAFPRTFQIWLYTVSHGQLLLRSTKDDEHPTRVDVLFKDVGAIHLPAICQGLVIGEATEEEKQQLCLQRGFLRRPDRTMFLVSGSDFSGYVHAGSVYWHEDEGEYYDSSYFSTSLERPRTRFYHRVKIRAAIFFARLRGQL